MRAKSLNPARSRPFGIFGPEQHTEHRHLQDLSVVDRVFHSLALNSVFNYDLTADSMTNTVMSRQ